MVAESAERSMGMFPLVVERDHAIASVSPPLA
jgi:hypothetical protein